jgi:hypothetical protein
MFDRFDGVSFFLGALFAYPILLLIVVIQPESKSILLSLVGLIFFVMGVIMKVSKGVVYRKCDVENNPTGYWFNMGTFVGFILLPWVVKVERVFNETARNI